MSKSVRETIHEIAQDIDEWELMRTAALEIELCERLVKLRLEAGLTQKDVAKLLNVSKSYVAKLEDGAFADRGIGVLRKFARALGYELSLDSFFVPASTAEAELGAVESC